MKSPHVVFGIGFSASIVVTALSLLSQSNAEEALLLLMIAGPTVLALFGLLTFATLHRRKSGES